jgi:hypothetical protein
MDPITSPLTQIIPLEKRALPAWKKVLIGLATVVMALISLVSLLLTVASIGNFTSSPLWLSIPLFIFSLAVTGALLSVTSRLNSMLQKPAPNESKVCQCCARGDVPTIKVGLNRHIGAVLLMFHKSFKGYLCRPCIKKLFWEYTPITFFLGWWGIASLVITPIVLISNIIVLIRSLSMERQTTPSAASPVSEAFPATRVI